MSPFLIFFIVVTLGYVIYYAAIITIDMNAKPKETTSTSETMETPDGMQSSDDNDDSEEETTSREADDSHERYSEDETDEGHKQDNLPQGSEINDVPPTKPPFERGIAPNDVEHSQEDDDVYGIDKLLNEEFEHHEEVIPKPSHEEQLPSNHNDTIESTSEEPTEEAVSKTEPSASDEEDDIEDEEDLEILKEKMRHHLVEVAREEGAERVDAVLPDKNEFLEEQDDGFRGIVDSQNCDTGRADDINQNNESIVTESTTPLRQDIFAATIMGAWSGFKKKKQEEERNEDEYGTDRQEQQQGTELTIDTDNIEKKEQITKL